jgi:hypothetical protein
MNEQAQELVAKGLRELAPRLLGFGKKRRVLELVPHRAKLRETLAPGFGAELRHRHVRKRGYVRCPSFMVALRRNAFSWYQLSAGPKC